MYFRIWHRLDKGARQGIENVDFRRNQEKYMKEVSS